MSPEQTSAAAALARLRAEIRDDRAAMTRRRDDLEEADRRLETSPRDPAAIALAAWALHGWYTALESLLERVARQLDAAVPTGDRWHRELLVQATVEVPGVRPAVLPAETRSALVELLGLRHFLRHAYGADLDPARLAAQAARLRAISADIDAALERFDAFLASAQAATPTA